MSGPGSKLNAAVVQAAPVAFDVEATLDKVERLTAETAAGGAFRLSVNEQPMTPVVVERAQR